jgi:hypothetical protein
MLAEPDEWYILSDLAGELASPPSLQYGRPWKSQVQNDPGAEEFAGKDLAVLTSGRVHINTAVGPLAVGKEFADGIKKYCDNIQSTLNKEIREIFRKGMKEKDLGNPPF